MGTQGEVGKQTLEWLEAWASAVFKTKKGGDAVPLASQRRAIV